MDNRWQLPVQLRCVCSQSHTLRQQPLAPQISQLPPPRPFKRLCSCSFPYRAASPPKPSQGPFGGATPPPPLPQPCAGPGSHPTPSRVPAAAGGQLKGLWIGSGCFQKRGSFSWACTPPKFSHPSWGSHNFSNPLQVCVAILSCRGFCCHHITI